MGAERARAQNRPDDVHVEDAPQIGQRQLQERRHVGDAGVVDQDVDAPEGLDHPFRRFLDGAFLRHVRRQRQHAPAHLLDGARGGRQLLGRARQQRHVRARIRQRARHRLAQPASPAGDHCDLTVEIQRQHSNDERNRGRSHGSSFGEPDQSSPDAK